MHAICNVIFQTPGRILYFVPIGIPYYTFFVHSPCNVTTDLVHTRKSCDFDFAIAFLQLQLQRNSIVPKEHTYNVLNSNFPLRSAICKMAIFSKFKIC